MADSRDHLEKKLSSDILSYTSPKQFTGNIEEFVDANGVNIGKAIRDQLREAYQVGDLEAIKGILETNNISINVMIGGRTLLMISIAMSATRADERHPLLDFVLKQPGIDLSLATEDGETALNFALHAWLDFKDPDYDLVRELINNGAKINQITCDVNRSFPDCTFKRTLLLTAWCKQNQAVANELIALGASIEVSEDLFNSISKPSMLFALRSTHEIVSQQIELSKQARQADRLRRIHEDMARLQKPERELVNQQNEQTMAPPPLFASLQDVNATNNCAANPTVMPGSDLCRNTAK